MAKVEQIVLEYICPSIGSVLATIMFAAPINALQEAFKRGYLDQLNPLPWVFMTGNCIGWIGYSYLSNDYFVLLANAPGLLISVWLNVGAIKLQYGVLLLKNDFEMTGTTIRPVTENGNNLSSNVNDPEPNISVKNPIPTTSQECFMFLMITLWLVIFSIVSLAQFDSSIQRKVVGIAVNLNLMFFYGAPLSTIFEVVKSRNSSSIHFKTTTMNIMNTSFWIVYGFAVKDPYILVPNGIGLLLGMIQLLLCLFFVRTETRHELLNSHD